MEITVSARQNALNAGFFELEHPKPQWGESYTLLLQHIAWGDHPQPGIKTFLNNAVWKSSQTPGR